MQVSKRDNAVSNSLLPVFKLPRMKVGVNRNFSENRGEHLMLALPVIITNSEL